MDRALIANKVLEIMRDIFDEDTLVYRDDLEPEMVEEWDSLNHIRLFVTLENEFGIQFATSEIESIGTAGAIVDAIAGKLS